MWATQQQKLVGLTPSHPKWSAIWVKDCETLSQQVLNTHSRLVRLREERLTVEARVEAHGKAAAVIIEWDREHHGLAGALEGGPGIHGVVLSVDVPEKANLTVEGWWVVETLAAWS